MFLDFLLDRVSLTRLGHKTGLDDFKMKLKKNQAGNTPMPQCDDIQGNA